MFRSMNSVRLDGIVALIRRRVSILLGLLRMISWFRFLRANDRESNGKLDGEWDSDGKLNGRSESSYFTDAEAGSR